MLRAARYASRLSAIRPRTGGANFFSFTRAASAGGAQTTASASEEKVATPVDVESSAPPPGPSAELVAALAALEASKKTLAEVQESRVYLAAEIENVRRIARNDVDKARAFGALPLAKSLLMTIDCLAAAEAGSGAASAAALKDGVAATHKLLLKALQEHGVAQFGAPHEKFDSNVHEAVMMVPSAPDVAPGQVVMVLKTGFMFKDRVLRPAQVAVSAKAEKMAEAKAAAEATAGSSRSI